MYSGRANEGPYSQGLSDNEREAVSLLLHYLDNVSAAFFVIISFFFYVSASR